MFDLNETINWKPKSTGEGRFGNWIKTLMTGTYLVQDRIPYRYGEPRTNKKKFLVGSVEELYNEIEKSIAAALKENPFKGFEVGNMDDSNYDLIDLHKNVVDQITLVSASENQ
jgi:isoleucyl-tRNA synthetase